MSADVLLLLSDPEAARLLADMLSRGRRVVVADPDAALDQPFGLGVVDGPALQRLWRKIAERKRAESPAFLPFLLVTTAPDVPLFARFLWTAVDELLQTPVQTPELLARVDVLLRARETSLRLNDPAAVRFRAYFDNDLAARWIASTDGRLLVCNPAFATLFGLASAEEVRHRAWGDFIPDGATCRDFLARLAAGDPIAPMELDVRRQDGQLLHGVVSATPQRQGGEVELQGAFAAGSAPLAQARREQLAERMESVGKLAGGIAHNFNNMLSTVLGYSDLLLNDLALDDPRRADVEEIRHAALRSAELTKQLLAYSRQQVLRSTELKLPEIALGMERTIRTMLAGDVTLTLALARDAPPIVADRAQLEKVLLNLVLNSRDATAGAPGGEVRIETRTVALAEPARSEIGVEIPAGEYAVLVVQDNGCGMDAATRSRAFEPFFTTKRSGEALGLGLSTAYGIVKQSGGFIWLESEPGQGATAVVYFPAVRRPRPEPAGPAEPARSDPTRSASPPTVLLVEDEAAVRTMAARILRQGGFTVLEATDGGSALDAVEGYRGTLDLLVTDLVMPGVGGVELADRISRLRPGMAVLFMSGYTEREVIDRGGPPAGTMLLNKPFRAGELVAAVRRALQGERGSNGAVSAAVPHRPF
ncbi:MAG TPA: ATP-binding protein [Gemmatimonadales bacterium]|nr:ATP-binding protein [Gemmatimonadales bacterium]